MHKNILVIVFILVFKRNKDILQSFSKLGDQAIVSHVFYSREVNLDNTVITTKSKATSAAR